MKTKQEDRTCWDWLDNGVEGLYREGEECISKNTGCSFEYARDVLRGRFKLGEERMWSRGSVWVQYVGFLKRKGIEI